MMITKKFLKVSFLLLVIASLCACASQRKCNGKRGVKTPMGLM